MNTLTLVSSLLGHDDYFFVGKESNICVIASPYISRAVTPVRLVSAIILQRDGRMTMKADEYVAHFRHIEALGIPVTLFLDPAIQGVSFAPHVEVRKMSLRDLPTFVESGVLPPSRDETIDKDTGNYMAIINAKPYLCSLVDARRIAWVDAGIAKHFRDPVSTLQRLHKLGETSGELYAPGGAKDPTANIQARSYWRFLGSFFVGSKETIQAFARATLHKFFQTLPKLTWEVDLWDAIENEGFTFAWYPGSFNESCLDFPVVETTPMVETIIYHAPPIRGGSHPVFALPRIEDVDYYERSGGAPELPLILWAETIVTKDAVLIDVGANVGTWSAIWGLLGHRAYPFEANPGMAALCNDTLRRNGLLENCKSYGLSDKSCTAVLRLPIDPNSPHGRGIVQDGGASLVSNFRGGDSSPLEVQLQTLDSFDFNSECEVFLKLDVEGAELDVLRGGRRFLETHRPKILFECWEDERGQRKEELFRFLHDELKYKTVKTSWPETWIAEVS